MILHVRQGGFFRNNGLSVVFFALFLGTLAAQSLAGWLTYNEDQIIHSAPEVDFSSYLMRPHFWQAMGENWESEFLQMVAYVLLTAFLFQRGSSESKDPDKEEEVDQEPKRSRILKDAPWPVHAGGWVLGLYRYSLTWAFLLLFLLSFGLHACAGVRKFNEEAAQQGQALQTLSQFLLSPDFWFESMQNWQSEFLAIFAMITLSIFLRHKGSPESKPLMAPHSHTGR